jgi:indoleamine 2,3-dioxygenase
MNSGFLPKLDPLEKLPKSFSAWENIARELPKLLVSKFVRKTIQDLPLFPIENLKNIRQLERAMQILSYLGHAYVWGEKPIIQKLPAILAKPWFEVSQKLLRPPVLSYASYALHNWKKIDKSGEVELGNIALIQNFLGGIDEEWFILVHVDIEQKAIPALENCILAIKAVKQKDNEQLVSTLKNMAHALEKICVVLDRMPQHCDPYIYYHRVRPYIHGWKNHPEFPQGLIYEGVEAYQNKPQQFRGETGAQSGIIPCIDGLLGITHQNDQLNVYLQEMRTYMPKAHRVFLEKIEKQSRVRQYIKNQNDPELKDAYNVCVNLVNRFRQTHLSYAASYIQHQHQMSTGNPNAVGTGGTPFMAYLKKHKDETEGFLLG